MNGPETSVAIHGKEYKLYRISSGKPLKNKDQKYNKQQQQQILGREENLISRVAHIIFKKCSFQQNITKDMKKQYTVKYKSNQ